MEINLDRTFIEKLEDIINNDILNNLYLKNHLIVFDIENDNKRKIFHDTLNNAKWIKYDEFIHEPDDNFNYLYFYGSYFDKIGLYNVLKKFNGKTIIFDNESILSKQSLINIIEGVVCRVSDSFEDKDFSSKCLKLVRKSHVKTDIHWQKNWKKANIIY